MLRNELFVSGMNIIRNDASILIGVQGQNLTSFVTVQYQNSHAVGKSINGLKNSSKVSLNQFNSILENISEEDIVKVGDNLEGKSYPKHHINI